MKVLIISVLLGLTCLIALVCVVALVRTKSSAGKVHYLGPVSILCPVFVAAAIIVDQGFSWANGKTILIAILLIAQGAIVAHATGRALRCRESGNLQISPKEEEDAL